MVVGRRLLRLGFLPAALLAACASDAERQQSYLAEGHHRDIPLLVYQASWSAQYRLSSTQLSIGFVNTAGQPIDAISIDAATCGSKGEYDFAGILDLRGPFDPDKPYAATPRWRGFGGSETGRSPHMAIVALNITFSDGTQKSFEGRQAVSTLLADGISNFCATNAF